MSSVYGEDMPDFTGVEVHGVACVYTFRRANNIMYSELSESESVCTNFTVKVGGAALAPVEADTCVCFVLCSSLLEH